MPFYDPTRCPDCRAELPVPPERCEACDLPLTGQTAVQLQSTLRHADQLVGQLRRPVALPVFPAPTLRRPERERRPVSVPAVLLGLGALCLLVAALVFLAVAWSWLGVGGRTAVLAALTATAGGLGLWLGTRGLRIAAESLTVVALGLVLLDVAGADHAGWLGAHPGGDLPASAYGVALALAALVLLAHPLRLVSAQLAAPAGLLLLVLDRAVVTDHARLAAALGVLALAALAGLGRLLTARALAWAAAGGAAVSWTVLAGLGLVDLALDPSLAGLWRERGAAALLAATALLALPVATTRGARAVLDPCLAVAGTLVTLVALVPVLDESATPALLTVAAAGAAWATATAALPRRWLAVTAAPTLLLALPLSLVALAQGGLAATRVAEVGTPFGSDAAVRLAPAVDGPHPVLLPLALLVVLATGLALLPAAERRTAAPWTVVPVVLAALGATALVAVPLVLVVAGLVALGVALVLVRRAGGTTAGLVLFGLAVAAALPSAALTVGAAAALTVVAGVLAMRAGPTLRSVGGALLPPALGLTGWATGEVADLDASYRSLALLLLLGLVAIARPRVELEVAAGLSALAVAAAGVDSSTSLAVHLTLAGVLVTTSALVHPRRRTLAWAGGLLLALATWVRLADLGVSAPEAYTLPSAVVLVLVGLRRLLRDPDAETATVLLPGLVLATVPSLLWVLDDPVSTRAVLLGAACLVQVLLGAQLRWGAPLLVGGTAGALLVLREAAPYLAETPQWILIGTAGALLTGVGITWERRLVELRRAGSYVVGLR